MNSFIVDSMLKCDSKGPLMIQITKLYPKPDCSTFDAFGRVFSGTIKVNENVKVLGEGYTLEDTEDMALKDVTKLWIHESRFEYDYIYMNI